MVARMKTKGLVNHLKKWGLKVEEKEGWRTRGRPYNFYPRAIIAHHTASGSSSGNFASDNIVTAGRSDLPGPLCQVLLGRDGTVRLIAAGYANHAGYGGPRASVPENAGNTYSLGIEAENNGVGEPWSKQQLNAYYRLCAALLVWMGIKDSSRVFGHKEWTSRKIDPAGLNMDFFRAQVNKAMKDGPRVQTIRAAHLRVGKRNRDVLKLKKALDLRGFSSSDSDTNFFGKGLTNDLKNFQRHIGRRGEELTGQPDWETLRKLGFRVVKK